MAEAQDVDTLKRRGRRRLVGAVALVLAAVIVLPMVFDPEPRRASPPVSVRIPGEDDTAFTPKMSKAPEKLEKKAPAAAPTPAPAPAALPTPAPPPAPAPVEEKKEKPAPAAEPKKAETTERQRAEQAIAGGAASGFVIPVGAFANSTPVTQKLAAAKIPYFTEAVPTAKGSVTRVRAGPFASKAEADKALETLKGLGFNPGTVSHKS